jgi:hypothetical protein
LLFASRYSNRLSLIEVLRIIEHWLAVDRVTE